MASITAMLSTLTVAVVIGHSVQHRPITLVHVAGTGPRILVVGCIHGNEPAGIAIVQALERTHPKADLWLVPVLNPDGLAADTRQNARPSGLSTGTRSVLSSVAPKIKPLALTVGLRRSVEDSSCR